MDEGKGVAPTGDAARPAGLRDLLRAGARERRGPWRGGATTALLLVVAASAIVLADALLRPPSAGGAHLVERPVAFGRWAIGWDEDVAPPAAEQAWQVAALRRVAGGTAALVGLLALLSALGLWRQRLLVRRPVDYVHWAVGARRAHLRTRLVGEAWPWAAAAMAGALLLAGAVPLLVARTFPGDARLPSSVPAVAALLAATLALLLRWEGRAGEAAARGREDPFRRWISGPGFLAALGVAGLSGTGLLLVHGRTAEAASRSDLVVVPVSLPPGDVRASRRALAAWLAEAPGDDAAHAPATLPERIGVASAGTLRGAGVRAPVWVDCGRCSEGGLPLPIRTVRGEVHAVGPDTFPRLGLRLLDGRDFAPTDVGRPDVAIVGEALARRHFERGEAIGRSIRLADTGWLTVVGIVSDPPTGGAPHGRGPWMAWLPVAQAAPAELELLAVAGNGIATLPSVRARAPAGITLGAPRTAREIFALQTWFGRLLAILGASSLALVVAGVRAAAAAETPEIRVGLALRRAVGASPACLRLGFAATILRRFAVALVVGAWLSLFLGVGLARAFPGMPVADPRAWMAAAAPVAAALLLGGIPAFRSALRDPPARALEP